MMNINNLDELTTGRLIKKAGEKTGSGQPGEIPFLHALDMMVASFKKKKDPSRLNHFTGEMVRLISNTMLMERHLKENRETGLVPVERPLFIVGMTRTGTTFLHKLLSMDPAFRTLKLYEMLWPVLPAEYTGDTDPRIQLAQFMFQKGKKEIHAIDVTEPEECKHLFRHTFMSESFYWDFSIDDYYYWLKQQDHTGAYQYFRKMLQVVMEKTPGKRLLLKDPSHVPHLGVLGKVFPGAGIIWTHRRLEEVVPSSLSLFSRVFSRSMEFPPGVSQAIVREMADSVKRGIDARREEPDLSVFDVDYSLLIHNPPGMVEKIYDFFGLVLQDTAKARMKKWLDENPAHKHGTHRYSLEQFSITSSFIKEHFREYIERFPSTGE